MNHLHGWGFAVFLLLPGPLRAAEPDAAGVAFFETKIRPVLAASCYECHSAKAKIVRGGLLLDTRDGIRTGGESGPAVVPGKPEDSLLLSALRHESFEMPPDGQLPERIIADVEEWIRLGAPDPRDGQATAARSTVDLENGRGFWSFQPLVQPLVPELKVEPSLRDGNSASRSDAATLEGWNRSPIDRFILARLSTEGIAPVGDADRATLIRRLSFDLTGLPPTPEEIDAFLADDAPDAVARLVDELLASPRFGERWGRHWLDVARFAESSGGGRTLMFPTAWRYRDYVIESFNQDKPFDEFAREQIAGDLLRDLSSPPSQGEAGGVAADKEPRDPQRDPPRPPLRKGGSEDADSLRRERLIALGFLVLGPTNYELQDKELLRMEVVDEQIDTIGKAFLGMTIGCARCHDHKFDPISHRDYHALAGIFRSTKTLTPGNVSGWVNVDLPILDPAQRDALAEHRAQLAAVQSDIKETQEELKQLGASQPPSANSIAVADLPGLVVDDVSATFSGAWSHSKGNPSFVGDGYQYAGAGTASARFEVAITGEGRYEVRLAYNAHPNRATNVPVTVRHADGEITTRINCREKPPIDGLFVSLGTFRFAEVQGAVIEIGCQGLDGAAIADAVQLLPMSDADDSPETGTAAAAAEPERLAEQQRVERLRQDLKRLETEKKRLEKAAPNVPMAMAVRDEAETGDYRICIRGNVHNLGEEVPRGFLSVLGNHQPQIPPDQSGRLQLADWLTAPDNPLFARVAVNRIWHHLFGRGLVPTPDNFGETGEPPSHPELLDHLALQFIDDGYSVKTMIRRIVLSRTYQLSSNAESSGNAEFGVRSAESGIAPSSEHSALGTPHSALPPIPHSALRTPHSIDPDNRLLLRQNRRRLAAEAIRDAILVVSGQLDSALGGSTIRPGTNSEFGYEFELKRRGVYVPAFRNTLLDLFEVFDLADPNLVTGGRNTSTLPTQALFLMNSPFVMEQSRHAAARLLAVEGLDESERINRAFLWTLGRSPRPDEANLTREYLRSFGDSATKEAWSYVFQSLFACVDFRYVE